MSDQVEPAAGLRQALLDALDTLDGGGEAALERLIREDSAGFCREGLALLGAGAAGPGAQHLGALLLRTGATMVMLCDPGQDLRHARAAALALAGIEPALDVRLLRAAWDANEPSDAATVMRILEVVSAFSDGSRLLQILIRMLRSRNAQVRSKAALLLARGRRDAVWIEQWLKDPDPRIRANAVEALWGDPSPAAAGLFRKAAADPHHRVEANAYVGLYHANRGEGEAGLEKMSRSPSPAHRAAACWAMGHLADRVFVPVLTSLIGAPQSVGFNAVRALGKIHRARGKEAAAEPVAEAVS